MPRRPAFDLTSRIASLTPGDYADAHVTGLTLRVRPSGRRTFVLRYRDGDGRSVKYKIGDWPNVSLAQARKLARALSGGDPQAERRAQRARQRRPREARTVADLIDRYLQRAETRMRASTLKLARQRLNAHVRPALGAMRIGEVRASDVRALMEALQHKGLGVTSNRCATQLGAVYRFAQRSLDMDVRNPLDGIDRDDRFRETPRQRILSNDELRRIWRACETAAAASSVAPATAIALQLAMTTLQRAGEVAGVTDDELDLERSVWTIPAARAKNGRDHHVPLSPLALQLIERARIVRGERSAPAPLFPSPRRNALGEEKPIARAALSHAFARIAEAVGARDAVLHDCRRTGATLLASMATVQMVDISRLLNHVSDRDGGARVTLGVYALRADHMPRKRRAAELWAGELAAIVDRTEAKLVHFPRAVV